MHELVAARQLTALEGRVQQRKWMQVPTVIAIEFGAEEPRPPPAAQDGAQHKQVVRVHVHGEEV